MVVIVLVVVLVVVAVVVVVAAAATAAAVAAIARNLNHQPAEVHITFATGPTQDEWRSKSSACWQKGD